MSATTPLRHRVGSLLIVGVEGESLSATESAWLRSLQPGGLILFRRNIASPTQIHSLFREAAAAIPSPFFRCVDLEGGTVDRLRDMIGPTPAAAEVAATNDPALFVRHGAWIGRSLHSLGFNVDLAPVLDLALPASRSVMSTRTASPETDGVIAYAHGFLTGLARHGVLGCGKHFPGLGGGTLDSHQATPKIRRTWEQLWAEDLAPYRALTSQLPLVMVSHAAYPRVERPAKPASLSGFWIEEVLRQRLRYRGIVLSDDMEMGGVLGATSIEEAAVESVASGMDMLEVCHRADRILATHEALLREAERSSAFRRRVTTAATRVAKAKHRWLGKAPLPKTLSAAGLRKLQESQFRLREQIAKSNSGSAATA